MSHSELLGISDGFALFSDAKGLTVVVNLSNLDVFDPVPHVSVDFSRWGEADPAQVPTEAFELADSALSAATRVEGTDVIIAGGAPDKRSFAIPKAAQEEAQKALAWRKENKRGGTDVGLNTARTLAKGGSVGIAKVRHIAKYFARHEVDKSGKGWSPGDDGFPSNGRIAWALWGGDPAWKWAAAIVKREKDLAVLAQLDFEPELAELEPEVEAEELADGAETYEPGEPHVYLPDPSNDYSCETCGNEEEAALHTLFPEEEEPEPVAASAGRPIVSYDDFAPGVPEPDMYISIDVNGDGIPDRVTGIYLRGADDTWQAWSPTEHAWAEAPMPSDAEPIDEDSAYATAILQDSMGVDAVPTNEIDPVEWDIVQQALPELGPEIEPDPSMEGVEFSATLDPDAGVVSGVYLNDLSTGFWKWDTAHREWAHLGSAPDEYVQIDAAAARDAAARLTRGFTDAGAFDREFSRAAWITLATTPDGVYTPEERSVNASRQVRDSKGRFTSSGSVVHVVGNNRTAVVVSVDPDKKTARIRYSDGRVQDIPLSELVRIGQVSGTPSTERRKMTRDDVERAARSVDVTGKAVLPKQLPIMTPEDIQLMLRDYDAFIKKIRGQEAGLKKYAALDPQTTDVPPLYLAQVDELDKQAVVDLFALVPASKESNEVILYTRKEGGWVRDDAMLGKLRSTSPPPIVVLDAETYKMVVEQVDSYYKGQSEDAEEPVTASLTLSPRTELWDEYGALMPVFEAAALVAAGIPGIADTPGDVAAARRLRNYWLRGRGAAKIRWNTPGDWTRCTRHLSKYMGIRARGYCQNLHKSATGLYTGDSLHRKLYGRKNLSTPTVVLNSVDDISADTAFLALLEIDIPTIKDLSSLSTREAGHHLRVGERFLVDGGDGIYAAEVLDPAEVQGWESTPAVLVAGESHTMLLQESRA